MSRKRDYPEQVIHKSCQTEVLYSQGKTVAQAWKEIEVSGCVLLNGFSASLVLLGGIKHS